MTTLKTSDFIEFSFPSRTILLALLIVSSVILSACGSGSAQADESGEQFQIREPRATFTPTSADASNQASGEATPAPAQAGGSQEGQASQGSDQPAGSTGSTTAENAAQNEADSSAGSVAAVAADPNFAGSQAIIRSPLVNGRGGPGTDFQIVGIVEEGRIFDVLSQNETGDWWEVCCYDDQIFWVIDDLVEIFGSGNTQVAAPAAAAPAPGPVPAAPAVPVPVEAAPAAPPEAEPAPADNFTFDLIIQEEFPETNVVRVFLYVFSEQVQALEGYSLQVTKDGNDLTTGVKSFGPQAGFTWPIATTRQRFQNLKLEFPGQSPAGTWVMQLIDGGGQLVGPPATFDLTGNEPNQELYVRYKQK